mmetsp:Transcript_10975/g.33901  ORF Transcript_10975/g.33901 Transcript_10975/m.33901 type:complete len:159 (-) Transcript_10975:728-1204(-)
MALRRLAAVAAVLSHTASSFQKAPAARPGVRVFGIFDGVKEAFSQETTILDEDRVTPFDRWLGIDVATSDAKSADFEVPDDFVDSMDEGNYVAVSLSKPMGIVFEENDPSTGGVFVASLADGGAAATYMVGASRARWRDAGLSRRDARWGQSAADCAG